MVGEIKGNIYKNEPLVFLLEDGQISESIEPYYMARVVDIEEFLKAYPFAKALKNPFISSLQTRLQIGTIVFLD